MEWLDGANYAELAERRQQSRIHALDAVAALGDITERQSGAIFDSKVLPLPKEEMKSAVKAAWVVATDDRIRNACEAGYIYLANFQDGVGHTPVDPSLPRDYIPERAVAILEVYSRFSGQVDVEERALAAEFKEFKNSIRN
ncbi:MAG: hypothetical protein ACRD40_01740 [Candidatus Acidiferrales bacterium]